MGPVSFCRFSFADRDEALDAARRLADVGIRVQTTDRDTAILVRNDDLEQANSVLAATGRQGQPPSDADGRAGSTSNEEQISAGLISNEEQKGRPIEPLRGPVDATIDLPGSKSHTNRALLCAARASGSSHLTRVLLADDTQAMLGSLERLGAGIELQETAVTGTAARIHGVGPTGFGVDGEEPLRLDVRQSGTTSRFLLPALAAGRGRFELDGDEQLRGRPFGPQVQALRALGADIVGDRLPLQIVGRPLAGGAVSVAGDVSSQFLSGLLLAAPGFARPTEITVEGELVSRPYVELTIKTMADFSIGVDHDLAAGWFRVPVGSYKPADVAIEPDASTASYFFAAAAMSGGRIRVDGLGRNTVQGDLRFVEVLAAMGAEVTIAEGFTEVKGTGELRGLSVDMSDISDTAQTLAVVAATATSPTEVNGIGFIRRKETDRIAAPVAELNRLGIRAEATDDGFVVHPGTPDPGLVETYDDHRMAMSFALLGLLNPGIVIANPGCVAKTFPSFFEVLDSLRR